jgi:internalin A
MPATNPSKPEPRRISTRLPRPLWIGVAAAVLVVVAVGLQFGVPIYRQQAAILEVERFGGTIEMVPRGPEWLRDHLSDERMKWFDDVVYVHLENTDATDATLLSVSWLPSLQVLMLDGTRVTDAGLVHLKRLTKLECLTLNGTQVTDAGLSHLKGLNSLEELSLDRTRVTDSGLAHLEGTHPLALAVAK